MLRKGIAFLLILTFLIGQTSTSFAYDNLAASLATDADINIARSESLQNQVAAKTEPGAIGNGTPLLELAQGNLPPKVTLQGGDVVSTDLKLREAISLAIRLGIVNKNKIPAEHRDRFQETLANLIDLQNHLNERTYLFNAYIKNPKDYLLGFNFGAYIGLSIELIEKLYSASPKRLAQYIFHECVPEKGIITKRDDHRVIYREIQSVIFGESEVRGLKKDLQKLIAATLNIDSATDAPGIKNGIAAELCANPFMSSQEICEKYNLSKEQLIDIYLELRTDETVQNMWANSKYREFFSIAAQVLPCRSHLERIIRGDFTFPLFVEFHSGGRCPNDCLMCYNRFVDDFRNPAKRRTMMDSAEITAIIDEIFAKGARILNVAGGGEPLTDMPSIDVLAYAKSKGMRVTLNTMGIGLGRPNVMHKILDIDLVRISINAATPETYEVISGKNRGSIFTNTCKSIKRLVKERNARNKKLKIIVSAIIVPENYKEIEPIIELAHELGVDSIYLRTDYAGITRSFTDAELAEINQIVSRIRARISQGDFEGTDISIDDVLTRYEAGESRAKFKDAIKDKRCWSQRFKIGIDAWGRIHECALVTQPGVGKFRHVLGDIRTDGSIEDILRNAPESPDVRTCLAQEITCNIFEGYFQVLIDKLKRDSEFGIPINLQPFPHADDSPYAAASLEVGDKKRSDFSLFDILETKAGRDLVALWINTYPNQEGLVSASLIRDIMDYVRQPVNRDEALVDKISKVFPALELMRRSYERAHADMSKPLPSASGRAALFQSYIKGPLVLDVGCGWNITGGEIIKNNPEVEKVIGVDIEPQAQDVTLPKGVSFKLMPDSLSIPMPDNSVDTAIISFVLHHVEVDNVRFMQEVNRVLKPGGRVIILEDTFSHSIQPEEVNVLTGKFFNLTSDEMKFSFLFFVDWFIHNFVNKSRMPLVPGNYKTMEEWNKISTTAGFKAVVMRHFGFIQLGSINPVNRGLLVLDKESSVREERLARQIGEALESPGDYDKLKLAAKASSALRKLAAVSDQTLDVLIQAAMCTEFDKIWPLVRWNVFARALKDLGANSKKVEECFAFLLMNDEDEYIQSSSAEALRDRARPFSPMAIEALKKGVDSQNPYISIACRNALGIKEPFRGMPSETAFCLNHPSLADEVDENARSLKDALIAKAEAQIRENMPVNARTFAANLIKILTDHPDQLFFMGIETDIGKSQEAQIMPIRISVDEIRAMQDASGNSLFPNLIVRREKAEKLVKMIRDLNNEGRLKMNNIFIGARKMSVDNNMYDAIKGEGRAWISAIDDSRRDAYIPVFEAITLNMMAHLNADLQAIKDFYDKIADEPIDIDILQDMLRKRIVYLMPRATAFDAKQLRDLYELARKVYISA